MAGPKANSPDPGKETYALLRDKIKSKMDVAKVLGTFLTGALSFLLAFKSDTIDPSFFQKPNRTSFLLLSGISLTLAAIILFFATVTAYDRLLMPFRYWRKEDAPDNDSLQSLMVNASARLFVPVGLCSALGIILLLWALLELGVCDMLLLILAPIIAVAYGYISTRRPGFRD